MTIVLPLKHYKILLSTAGIAYENTYDMREDYSLCSRKEDDALNRRIDCTEIAALLVFNTKKYSCAMLIKSTACRCLPARGAPSIGTNTIGKLLLARQAQLAVGHELDICAQIFSIAVRSAKLARMRCWLHAVPHARVEGKQKEKRARTTLCSCVIFASE